MTPQTLAVISGVVLLLVFVLVGWRARRRGAQREEFRIETGMADVLPGQKGGPDGQVEYRHQHLKLERAGFDEFSHAPRSIEVAINARLLGRAGDCRAETTRATTRQPARFRRRRALRCAGVSPPPIRASPSRLQRR